MRREPSQRRKPRHDPDRLPANDTQERKPQEHEQADTPFIIPSLSDAIGVRMGNQPTNANGKHLIKAILSAIEYLW